MFAVENISGLWVRVTVERPLNKNLNFNTIVSGVKVSDDFEYEGSDTKKDAASIPPQSHKKTSTIICGLRGKKQQYKSYFTEIHVICHSGKTYICLLKPEVNPSNCNVEDKNIERKQQFSV